jgi:hypothetical protein
VARWCWTGGGFIVMAAFLVTTWSLQRVSQMEHKDVLYATYRLKIAISYRSKRHLSLRDKCFCPYEFLIKKPNN